MIVPQGGQGDTLANASLQGVQKNNHSESELLQVSSTPHSVQVQLDGSTALTPHLEFLEIVLQPATKRIQVSDLHTATDIRLGDARNLSRIYLGCSILLHGGI